jgi:hypothetical protein
MSAAVPQISYRPPPTIKAFIKYHEMSSLFYAWIIGPVGSGKTTGIFFKLVVMAKLQAPSPDGIRRTRAVVIRNTMPQLKDTTLVSWGYWFKDGQAGHWNATDKIFTLRFDDVECIVLFRPLDTPDDVNRVLSLEINFAVLDEFVEIPKAIIDALSARLGRYKQPDGTPVTIWGMWGSSNTSTEDNWWFDYLHSVDVMKYGETDEMFRSRHMIMTNQPMPAINTMYFHQPGGMTDEAENLENLPPYKAGDHSYYLNLKKGGRSLAWQKQFIDAEWGYSASGQAVTPFFRPHHVSSTRLKFNPGLQLIIGLDPGITGSAMILMQEDYSGRINVLREIVQRGYGAERMIRERLLPVLKNEFPTVEMDRILVAADPASINRAQTDERTVIQVFAQYFNVWKETNNRFPLRLGAYERYLNMTAEGDFAFQIDPVGCPSLVRGLKGGWRYASEVKKEILKGAEPDKNEYSHACDALGYGLRYCHVGMMRFEKYGRKGGLAIPGAGMGYVNTPWGVQNVQRLRGPGTSAPKYHYT